jgi:hypothetical protein
MTFMDSLVFEYLPGSAMLSPEEWDALLPNIRYYNRLMNGMFTHARQMVEQRT